jgi:hypothetical protein
MANHSSACSNTKHNLTLFNAFTLQKERKKGKIKGLPVLLQQDVQYTCNFQLCFFLWNSEIHQEQAMFQGPV